MVLSRLNLSVTTFSAKSVCSQWLTPLVSDPPSPPPLAGEHRPPSAAVLEKNAEAELRLWRSQSAAGGGSLHWPVLVEAPPPRPPPRRAGGGEEKCARGSKRERPHPKNRMRPLVSLAVFF